MKSVALHNLGCKVNGYELDVIQQKLQENGYKIVSFDECADIYIINTCTVTNIADKKSRQMIHRAKKKNPAALVVALGCYVQTGREEVLHDEAIDLAIGNNKKGELIPILDKYMACREEKSNHADFSKKTLYGETILDVSGSLPYEQMTLARTADHTRASIKIQDGCNQFCSYCIIPYVRGRVRSRSRQDIIEEIYGLVKQGYKEVVLTGIHISSYGTDQETLGSWIPDGGPLLQLLESIHEMKGLERIRLGSLEPRIINPDIVKRMANLHKLCPHFHLSLQSGCDATLKRMNRHYTTGEYYEKVQMLRECYKDPAITTDIIVGFPGETPEEFMATYEFAEQISFYEMHVFKYSKREGTKAAAMTEQVRPETKVSRSTRLIELGEELSYRYRKQFLHTELEVLVEENKEVNGKIYQIGYTKEYVRTALPADKNGKGSIVKVTADSFLQPDILLAH